VADSFCESEPDADATTPADHEGSAGAGQRDSIEDYAVGAGAETAEARSWMYWAMTAVALR
jgi:hypothetical protein